MSGSIDVAAVLVAVGQFARVVMLGVFITEAVIRHGDAYRATSTAARRRHQRAAAFFTVAAIALIVGALDDIVSGDWQ